MQIILAARGRITTHFHEDIGRGFLHRGIDQGHGDGNAVDLEIKAPADGLVTFYGLFGSYGNVLFITHDDGWVSVLAHHAEQFVSKGDRVTRGQVIARMGNTGTVYVHNHQELRDADGNQVDPLLHLGASAAALKETPLPPIPKDDDVTIYLKPTSNSSQLSDGISRIWTGYRTIAGIDYADVWGVDGNGTARRLTAVQWRILNALPKEAITLNVVELTGNELEQIVYAPSF